MLSRQISTKKVLVKDFLMFYIPVMLEKEIENYFVWTVETLGGKAYKFKSPMQRGVADRIACMPNGETWFVELKRPKGGRLAPLQKLFKEEVESLQQQYALFWSKEMVDEWAAQFSR